MPISPTPFFAAKHFAVMGASTDRSKFGNKVLRWYQARELDVVPINPKSAGSEIEGLKAVGSLGDLKSKPEETSISVITPPAITLSILQQALSLNFHAIWLQPGAENNQVSEYIKGKERLREKVTFGGPCVLVLGDGLIKDEGGKMAQERL